MSTARATALRRILIAEGINIEVLKEALDTDIETYTSMIRDELEEDRLEGIKGQVHQPMSRYLESYFLLRQAIQ